MYEVKKARQWKKFSIKVDSERRISSVAVKEDAVIKGIRFIDDKAEVIAEQVWNKHNSDGQWTVKSIPIGMEILGLICSLGQDDEFL